VIAVDSSSMRRYLDGATGTDVESVTLALRNRSIVLPPVAFAELMSDPRLPFTHAVTLTGFRVLSISAGYWLRAAELRASILREDFKASLPDTLIAQSCIDHDIPLITYDRDFRHFQRAGLQLV
jgi:predicted nucleic acid-binding protein